jgi:hypothetical protein
MGWIYVKLWCTSTTIKEFINSNKDPNVNIFIRPNGDGKNLMDR